LNRGRRSSGGFFCRLQWRCEQADQQAKREQSDMLMECQHRSSPHKQRQDLKSSFAASFGDGFIFFNLRACYGLILVGRGRQKSADSVEKVGHGLRIEKVRVRD
jgi:hypothetical protein